MISNQPQIPHEFKSVGQIVPGLLKDMEKRRHNHNGIVGLSTGFEDVDCLTDGLEPGCLMVVASRPSMGKTILCLQICAHIAAYEQRSVAIFGYSQSSEALFRRIIAARERITSTMFRNNHPDVTERIEKGASTLSTAPLFIDAPSNKSLDALVESSRRFRAIVPNLGAILVDDISGMLQQEDSDLDGGAISSVLKDLAVECQVSVVAVNDVSSAVEDRQDKRPTLRDIRTCGRLDYSADIVCGIYRESYYNPESLDNTAELIFLKNPKAGYGTVELDYDSSCGRYSNKVVEGLE